MNWAAAVCRTLSHDPLALDPNCIHIVDAQVFAYSTYHLVASDDNDFNALLPAWGIREAYIGPGNTLASVSSPLCHAVWLPALWWASFMNTLAALSWC